MASGRRCRERRYRLLRGQKNAITLSSTWRCESGTTVRNGAIVKVNIKTPRQGEDTTPNVPLLRWAGSKKRQYQALRAQFPTGFGRYVEPFAGSAAFLFRMGCRNAIINDINTDVCRFYEDVREHTDVFLKFMAGSPRSRECFYDTRAKFNAAPSGVSRSIYFYYLNRNCFNGIYRVSKSGKFNVPFAQDRVAPYLDNEAFRSATRQLGTTQIRNQDFSTFIATNVVAGDFVFLDPPYYVAGTRVFGEYTPVPFGPRDLERLARSLGDIDAAGARFLLTYPATDESAALARGWLWQSMTVRRSIAGDPSFRRNVQELLIRNYEPQDA